MPSVRIPTIIERTPRGERAWDLFSRLLQERVIMLGSPIDEDVSVALVAQLLFLQHSDPERDIWFYINSPGGSVRDGLAIYDTMQLISPDVNTVCIGMAGSMATVLLAGGAKGKRYALPNSTIHFHPASAGMEGSAPDVERAVNELLRLQRLTSELIGQGTGKTANQVEIDFSRDRFLTAGEAKEYGFIDHILDRSAG
ncbi:MAG TPA: ATP-dependent Clp protease proteolytic subunit [Kouleothrix sp.]|uniref:ClpP family protease n=1 Tax=Kouleothrix sp. TaxID=2779161 RepID=UPI002D0D6B35|nr:ATP-dependent Clp protease proteolytic subunit [Kouleothrix sp.]HRC74991.1 ATP-dependent Clp protease proteolytic subunit [Kouleothrix sp.]